METTTAVRIKAHQTELHAQRMADGLKKWQDGKGEGDDSRNKVVKKYESYKREEQLPRAVEDRRVSFQGSRRNGKADGA